MNYAQIIRDLCNERGIAVSQLPNISKVPLTTINKWIYGLAEPTINNFEKVINALGYKLEIIKEDEQ